MGKSKKVYNEEFKQDAVNYYYTSGKGLEEASKHLKISKSSLSKWVNSAKENNGVVQHRGSGNYSSDSEKEIAQLKKELRDSKDALEILKKGYKHTERLTESIYTETNKRSKKRKVSVNSVLKLLGVSSSGYYSWLKRKPSNLKCKKEEAKIEINKIYNESNQIYGAPKITKILHSNGWKITEKTVENYMRGEGIKAIWVTPFTRTTIDPDFDINLKDILAREFNPTTPNTAWVTDITYIHTLTGFVYLTCVMDLFSRKIVGWHLSDRLATEGVIKAIEKAKTNRKLSKPVIIHSDRSIHVRQEVA